ncbi:putative F-box protein At5g62660 [Papaver somniferum]|uniref:putative F-box protein At5g62660 n=1 Tax=Papaver somniferum TaxID=3469 RepID=UPI000E6FB7CA|nr:putative F-box protein At5g62660 [Papaver somniferum]
MEVLRSYDVSPHFYHGTSRNRSIKDLVNTSYHGLHNSPLDIIPTQVSILPNDIVIDILSKLPVKSLMQFKSVCKHWLSLIKHDTQLIDLHFVQSKSRPNLLYINPLPEKGDLHTSLGFSFSTSKTLKQSISCAEIVDQISGGGGEEKEEVNAIVSKARITHDQWFPYSEILEPVNGLVCFVDWNAYAVRVYNASTRETTPWVISTLLAEENDKLMENESTMKIKSHSIPSYRFGFDPEKSEHKVFCFWRLVAGSEQHRYNSLEQPDYESWEVLTVGRDTKSRRINAVPNENNQIRIKEVLPPVHSSCRQVYADGTIYWSNKEYYSDEWGKTNPNDPDVIVAFDVGSEKYRLIPIPSFILDEPRDESFRLPIDMLVLGGQVALLYRMEPYVVKLWMLDDS